VPRRPRLFTTTPVPVIGLPLTELGVTAVELMPVFHVSSRHSDEFATCFRRPKMFGAPHDLIQLFEQLNLLIDQQFRVTDDVD
jgi:hypothetical protein